MLLWSFYFIIVPSAAIFIIFILLLWIYSGAPSLRQKRFESKSPHRVNSSSSSLSVPLIIHRPHEFSRGYLNIHRIEEKDWLVLNKNVAFDMGNFRDYFKCPFTFMVLPGYEHQVFVAAIEVLDLIIVYLNNHHGGYVSKNGDIVCNHATGEQWVVSTDEKNISCDLSQKSFHPLIVSRSLIGEDLVIMIRNSDVSPSSVHILAGAVLLFPDDWNLEEKLGEPLAAIHYPVVVLNTARETAQSHAVPSRSTILRAMEFFFDKLYREHSEMMDTSAAACEEDTTRAHKNIYGRYNWTFQHHPHMPNRFHGPLVHVKDTLTCMVLTLMGDDRKKEMALRAFLRELFVRLINRIRAWPWVRLPPLEVKYRSERQTLRLLPRSHCVLFTIHTQVTPLSELVDSSERARLLEEAVSSDSTPTDTRNKALYRQEVLHWIASHFPATKK